MAKMAQNSAPYYGLMVSRPPKVLRPIMVSSLMVSVLLDWSHLPTPFMVSFN